MIDIRNYFAPYIGPPGLKLVVNGGALLVAGSSIAIPGAILTLSANATNYVYINTSTALFVKNTTGFPATNCYPVASVITSNTDTEYIADMRPDVGGVNGTSGSSSTLTVGTPAGIPAWLLAQVVGFVPSPNNLYAIIPTGGNNSGSVSGFTITTYCPDLSGATELVAFSCIAGGMNVNSFVPGAFAPPGTSGANVTAVNAGVDNQDDTSTNAIHIAYIAGLGAFVGTCAYAVGFQAEIAGRGGFPNGTNNAISVGVITSYVLADPTTGTAIGLCIDDSRGPEQIPNSPSITGSTAVGIWIKPLAISGTTTYAIRCESPAQSTFTGPMYFNGHIGASVANKDLSGVATITASTSNSVTFTNNFTATTAPVVVLTPTTTPATAGVYWVTMNGGSGAWTGFTVHITNSTTIAFNYVVVGNPN